MKEMIVFILLKDDLIIDSLAAIFDGIRKCNYNRTYAQKL